MPPRLPSLAAQLRPALSQPNYLTSFLVPFLQARHASVSILSALADNPGAYNKRIRRGRGPSSGKGKTSGRGHKGQKQHGKVPAKFQGGQTPLAIVKGERGFNNNFSVEMSTINLGRIQEWINQGRLDPTQPITLKELAESRCIHRVKDGVKLLAEGKQELKTALNVLVSRASASAIEAVEAAGGKVTTRYYTPQSIRRILRGESVSSFTPFGMDSPENEAPNLQKTGSFMYRVPDPTSRKDLEYYRDKAHRGYLSHLVEEGQGPSLYFRAPFTSKKNQLKKAAEIESGQKISNRVW